MDNMVGGDVDSLSTGTQQMPAEDVQSRTITDLRLNMAKLQWQINSTMEQLEKLRKVREDIVSRLQASRADGAAKRQSLAETIYSDNWKKARLAHAQLDHLDKPPIQTKDHHNKGRYLTTIGNISGLYVRSLPKLPMYSNKRHQDKEARIP